MEFGKIFSDSLFSGLRISINILRGIVLIPVITKLLGEAAFGKWVVLLAIVDLVASVAGLHLHGVLIRYTPREDRHGQVLIDTLSLGFITALLSGLALYVVGRTFKLLPQVRQNESLLVAVSLLVGIRIIVNIFRNYPRAQNRVKTFEVINLSKSLIESVFLVSVFWWYKSLTLGFWTLVAVSIGFSITLGVIYLPREIRTPNVRAFGQYLRYGIPMIPKVLGSRLLSHTDKYLLSIIISPTAVAVYAVSYSMATLLQNFTSPLNSTLYPAVSKAWENEQFQRLSDLYTQIFRGYTLIGIPAVVGLSLLATPLLTLISTERIARQGVYILPALAVTFYVRGYDNPLSYVINAAEENVKLAKIMVIAAVTNIVLNLVGIPLFGVFGAVIATLISQTIVAGYIYITVRKKISIDFPVGTTLRSLFATLAMAVVIIAQPFVLSSVQKVILFPLIGVFTYVVALYIFGEFSRQEIRLFVSLLKNSLPD